MAGNLDNVSVPVVPAASRTYNAVEREHKNNILRLFFNKIVHIVNSLLGTSGGRYIDNPNGLFFSTSSQTLAAANTGYAITFNQTYLGNDVSIANDSEITTGINGVYNFQFSGQLTSTNASAKNVYIWLNRNGSDITYSTHAYTISGSGTEMAIIWDFSIDMQEDSYIEIHWAADDTNVTLTSSGASSPHPGMASAVVSVLLASALPPTLPTLP